MPSGPNHPTPNPPHFLKEWRNFMGWTQEELAEMAGVHHTKIGRIEKNERNLKTNFLQELAGIFGVPSSAILEVNPSTKTGAQTAEMLLAWNKLTLSQRGDILKMVRALTDKDPKSDAS